MTLITLTIDTDTHAVVPKVATDEMLEARNELPTLLRWRTQSVYESMLASAPPPPSVWQPMSRDGIVELVKEAMLFCWNDFCVDTGNHPSDIEQHPRKCLSFHPSYWAEHTGQYVADRLTSRPPEQTP